MSTASGARSVHPVGDRALLLECAGLAEVLSLHVALTAAPLPGQEEVVAAARTLLVRATDRRARDRLVPVLRELPAASVPAGSCSVVTIDTVYDGADLAAVADLAGMSTDAVVTAHARQEWTAAFGGFAPGFAYLVGEHGGLDVPRRPSPRTSVPAGAVALAGGFSAVYPRSSPGGWQLVGRTDAPMWDLDRDRPALVRPGDRVRFRPVRELVAAGGPVRPSATTGSPARAPVISPDGDGTLRSLTVFSPGPQSLVQDLGRPGLLDLGVSPSGAADRASARQANRLVGNDRSAAVVEAVLGGLELRAHGHHVVAVCGATVPLTILRDGEDLVRPVTDAPFALPDGCTLRVGQPADGVRAYVAVRGGIDVPPVLGSRSTDVLSGLGPPPLTAGTVLPVGEPPGTAVSTPEPARVTAPRSAPVSVAVVPGPRADWVTPDSLDRLLAQTWTVTDRSNRVGLRLDGRPLERASEHELPSEGTVAGAVQLPADGLPVVFLADHPVTGGYPVVAVVRDADLDVLAQLRPGEPLRFRLDDATVS